MKPGTQAEVQGYTSYFNKTEFIVIGFDKSFQKSTLLLVIGLIALAIFTTIATPLLLQQKYITLYRFAQKEHTNHLFVIWAAVIVCFIANVIILTLDIYFLLAQHMINSEYAAWPSYLAIGCAVPFVILNLLLVVFIQKRKDFPLPYVVSLICCNTGVCFKGSTVVIQTLAMWVVTIFMQLVAFHLTFIFLAFVASPVQTGSSFLLFATGVLSTISIVTLFLASVQSNFSLSMTDTQKKRFFHSICLRSFRLVPFFSLLVFTIFFATCFIRVTIYVGDYQSGGIPSLFASLAPAILLGTMGYFGRHVLIKYVPRRPVANELPTTTSDVTVTTEDSNTNTNTSADQEKV